MNRHRKVVLPEGDHALAECADRSLAPHPLLELEADEDPQPQHEFANPLVGTRVARQRREIVDCRHQGVHLLLGLRGWCGLLRGRQKLGNPSLSLRLLGDQRIEGPGDGGVPGVVLLGGHPTLGGRDVVIEFGQLLLEGVELWRPLLRGDRSRFRVGPLEQPLSDDVAAPGLVDQLQQRVDEHGRQRGGLDGVVVALGVAAVAIAAAHVLELRPIRNTVHDAAAAVGQVDDSRRERISVGIGRLLAVLATYIGERLLFWLQSPPSFGIDERLAAACAPHADLFGVLEQLWLAVGTEVVLVQRPGAIGADPPVPALGTPAVLLDAGDDGVGAEIANRVGMPLARDAVFRAMIAAGAAGIWRRDAHLVESGGDSLAALTGCTPFDNRAPVGDLLWVTRKEANVMASTTGVLAVFKPLYKLVIRSDECPPESIRSAATGAQSSGCHALLHEYDSITEPRRKFAVLLVLDDSADEIQRFVRKKALGGEGSVVGHKSDTIADEFVLQCHHREEHLRAAEAIAFEHVYV